MARKKNAKVTDVQLTKPQTRLERYLGTIAGLFSNAPTDPRTRLERYLDAIVRGGVPITPDTPTSVEGLLYGNSEGKVEGVVSDMSAQNIEDYLEAVQAAVAQGGVPGFSQLVRPNLLDNAYFVGGGSQQGGGQFPINQRAGYVVPDGTTYYSDDALTTSAGTTSAYTTAVYVNTTYGTIDVGGTTYYVAYGDILPGYVGIGYGIDRWISFNENGIVTLSEDGVNFIAIESLSNFPQRIEQKIPLGATITCSILLSDGTFAYGSGVVTSAGGAIATAAISGVIQVYFSYRNNWVVLTVSPGAPVKVKAVKLELGANQTLAHQENGVWVLNEIPKYGEKLLECQRYFQLYATQSLRPSNASDCRPVMRVTPTQGTIDIDGTTYYYNDANL